MRSGRESDRFLFSGSILSVGEYIARSWMGTASLFGMAASLQGVCKCGGQLRQVISFAFFAAGWVRKWGPENLDMSFWVFDDLRYSNNNGDSGWRG